MASAQAVLNDDERELGVGLIDIGGGTSDVALYQQGSIRHTMVFAIAGNHFTNDLAYGIAHYSGRCPTSKARVWTFVTFDVLQEEEIFEVEMVRGDKTMLYNHTINRILSHVPKNFFFNT